MNTAVTEKNAQEVWNEVAAERAGTAPAAPVVPAETPVPAEAAAETPAPEAKSDPMAEVIAKIASFEETVNGRMRNVEGKIGFLNGQQTELKTLIDASKAAAAQVSNAPTQGEVKSAATNPAEWEELKKDYPEWATATEKFFESRQQPSFDARAFETQIAEQLKGVTAAVRSEIIDASLDAVFPGWKEDIKTEGFEKWSAAQSDAVKALSKSNNVGDAARMLRLYEKSKEASPENAIQQQRQQTLAAATSTPKGVRTPTVAKAWADMTPQEQWDSEKRTRAKRAGR